MQIHPDLVVHEVDPLNCEVRISRLVEGGVTPNERFFIRNHFAIPPIDGRKWRLDVDGLVEQPLSLSLSELMREDALSIPATLECAGNGRSLFDPPIKGEQWELGAVSTARWTGAPLSALLERARVKRGATHIVMRGADTFERSVSLKEAGEIPVVLAYEMNGEPMRAEHGFPLRAIVPSWYAVASVKWLAHIDLTNRPSEGYFQLQRYVYERARGVEPVQLQKVRSLITDPEEAETVPVGDLTIRGVAWSGTAPLAQVHVSVNGSEWLQARLIGLPDRYAWRQWDLVTRIERPGEIAIRSRATAVDREIQPEQAEWNRLGYGNNSIQTVRFRAG